MGSPFKGLGSQGPRNTGASWSVFQKLGQKETSELSRGLGGAPEATAGEKARLSPRAESYCRMGPSWGGPGLFTKGADGTAWGMVMWGSSKSFKLTYRNRLKYNRTDAG